MKAEFDARLAADQALVEQKLATLYPGQGCADLHEAMRYSLLAGGKRLRPVLCLAFSRLLRGDDAAALQAGAAVEMVHTYSLIHDDLPCMDNDDLRRGRPTSHRVFGEAGAVLAGDALLTEAFFQLTELPLPAERICAMVRTLSCCAGAEGMVGGQALDLRAETVPADAEGVADLQNRKTGALFRAACQLGVLCAGGDAAALQAAGDYAAHLGRAFQIRDDLLDLEGSAEKLGKATGMDGKKSTFLTLFGADWCRNQIRQETEAAQNAIRAYTDSEFLCALAEKMAIRDH